MNKEHYPIALAALGTALMMFVIAGAKIAPDGHTKVPLLALLAICEFAFFSSLVGAYLGYRQYQVSKAGPLLGAIVACGFLALLFLMKGLALWPK
ncbi:MAG: hypothetical protein AAF387_12185 [Pseudomonadota bacterium]